VFASLRFADSQLATVLSGSAGTWAGWTTTDLNEGAAMTELHMSAIPTARGADALAGGLDDSVYNRLLKERIIVLGSEVTDQVANRICAQLLLLAAEDPERDINLWINSPGGSVYSGMAIYDTMQFVANDVATVGMGMAASMGQLLLCAGAKGKRIALPHARIMMHQPSGGIGGTAADIAIQAEQMLYTKRMFQERVSFHTGQSRDQIEADSDRDRWFTAEEAKDYGFIDKVISGATQVPEGAGTRA
jgi:ATP-dependent Clp protease protease subunit